MGGPRASNVTDCGGIKRVDCVAKTEVPAVTPTYMWEITASTMLPLNHSITAGRSPGTPYPTLGLVVLAVQYTFRSFPHRASPSYDPLISASSCSGVEPQNNGCVSTRSFGRTCWAIFANSTVEV